MRRRLRAATAIVAAMVLPFATCLVQYLLWDYLKPFAWFLFYPTTFFSSRIGGRVAGIASTLVSAALVVFFFMPPRFSFAGKEGNNLLSVVVFIATGLLFSYTHDRLARAKRDGTQAEEAALKAREQLHEARLALLESEKQRADDRRRASEELLGFAMESCHIGAWQLDADDLETFRSPEHDRIFGYQQMLPQWSYRQFLEHVLPEERARVDATIRGALAGPGAWHLECRIRRGDGELRWIWLAGRYREPVAGGAPRMAGVVQDITERKRAEEALRAVEVARALALDAAQAGTWEWHVATGRNVWSEEVWKLYGLADSGCEPSYATWLATVRPEDRPRFEAALAAIVHRGAELDLEWQLNTADGSERWLMSRGRPQYAADGSVSHYLGIVIDISERKSFEQRLERRNEELERFDRASVERELEMIRLKRRVNDLCVQAGLTPPYDLRFTEAAVAGTRAEPS